jgi:SAM-dependent methyltransferase
MVCLFAGRRACAYSETVVVGRDLHSCTAAKSKVLDFGSGVGPAAQMFIELGYEVTLADISTPMLDFARYRLERRGTAPKFINLNEASLAPRAYDAVAAINTFATIPNIFNTASMLHAAIRLDGTLYADIDVSPRHHGAERFYDDDLSAKKAVRSAGFVAEKQLARMVRYRRVPASGAGFIFRSVRDDLVGDARRIVRRLRRLAS